MAGLGPFKRGEKIPINLTLEATPTGTPQYRILDADGVQTAALDDLEGSGLYWYVRTTPVTVPASGQGSAVGSYSIEYVAVIDGVTRYTHDNFEVTVNKIDDVKDDTETIIANLGVPVGARSIVFNVKDGTPNPVQGVKLSVHNSNNDDSPQFGILLTDGNGNTPTINLDDATYKIRVANHGIIVPEVETVVVTQSETINLTVAKIAITPPADPGLCKLFFFPQKISQTDVTDAKVRVRTSTALALVGGVYVDNRESLMVADTSTDPDNYYINAKIGAEVKIIGPIFGFNHDITVPNQATLDLSTLITS
jgi:hypothetical protein